MKKYQVHICIYIYNIEKHNVLEIYQYGGVIMLINLWEQIRDKDRLIIPQSIAEEVESIYYYYY